MKKNEILFQKSEVFGTVLTLYPDNVFLCTPNQLLL